MAMFTPCLHELGLIGYALSLSGIVVTGTNIAEMLFANDARRQLHIIFYTIW